MLWKATGWEPSFGGENDNGYVFRGMMWADIYWLFCDKKRDEYAMSTTLSKSCWTRTWNRKQHSCGGTSTCEDEDMTTLRVGGRGKTWDLPFREVFDVLGYRFHCNAKGFQGAERTFCKGMASW